MKENLLSYATVTGLDLQKFTKVSFIIPLFFSGVGVAWKFSNYPIQLEKVFVGKYYMTTA